MSSGDAALDLVEGHLRALAPFRQSNPPAWAQHDLNFGQLRVLLMLGRSGSMSVGQFASSVGVTPATASELLDRLERRGLVRRFHRTDDRRVVDCDLTEQGTQLVAQVTGARRQAMRRILSVLTPDELGQLDRLLVAIAARLDAVQTDLDPAGGSNP